MPSLPFPAPPTTAASPAKVVPHLSQSLVEGDTRAAETCGVVWSVPLAGPPQQRPFPIPRGACSMASSPHSLASAQGQANKPWQGEPGQAGVGWMVLLCMT